MGACGRKDREGAGAEAGMEDFYKLNTHDAVWAG